MRWWWLGGFFAFPQDMLLNSLGTRTKQLQNKWGREKAKTWPCWERSAKRTCQDQAQRKEDWRLEKEAWKESLNGDAGLVCRDQGTAGTEQMFCDRAQLAVSAQTCKRLKSTRVGESFPIPCFITYKSGSWIAENQTRHKYLLLVSSSNTHVICKKDKTPIIEHLCRTCALIPGKEVLFQNSQWVFSHWEHRNFCIGINHWLPPVCIGENSDNKLNYFFLYATIFKEIFES